MWIFESDYEIVKQLNEKDFKLIKNMLKFRVKDVINDGTNSLQYIKVVFFNGFCENDFKLYEFENPVLYNLYIKNNLNIIKIQKEFKKILTYKKCLNKNQENIFIIKDHMKQDYSQIENLIERIGV